jgi:hypothetical protein
MLTASGESGTKNAAGDTTSIAATPADALRVCVCVAVGNWLTVRVAVCESVEAGVGVPVTVLFCDELGDCGVGACEGDVDCVGDAVDDALKMTSVGMVCGVVEPPSPSWPLTLLPQQ